MSRRRESRSPSVLDLPAADKSSPVELDRVTEEVVAMPPVTERRARPRVPGAESGEWARLPRCRLVIVGGPDEGKVFAPTREQIVLGSQESADVVLADAA